MDYEENKVDKALNFIGMYSSFEEVKDTLCLSEEEFDQLKHRAKKKVW